MRLQKLDRPLRYLLTAFAGAVFAILVYRLWSLEARYLAAVIVAVTLIALSMPFLSRFPDFLLSALFFSVPLTAFSKYLFLGGYSDRQIGIMRFSGAVSVGPIDLLLIALFGIWLIRIVVTRQESFPRLERPDLLILLLVVAYVFSIPGTAIPKSGAFAVVYLGRYLLVYLYVSRHLERRHLPWVMLAFGFTILAEGALAGIQYTTGKWIGLALDRGAGVRMHEQYLVPGIEHRTRATGSVSESHTFGIYVTMLVQYAFVFVLYSRVARTIRVAALGLLAIGLTAIVLSLSRSAWFSCAIALIVAWVVRLNWGEKQLVLPALLAPLAAAPFLPWGIEILMERFSQGGELLTERFDQFPVAWAIWKDHLLFGYGVGNYMEALDFYNVVGVAKLPVHNVFLWAAAETGIVGVVAFFGILFAAMRRSLRLVRSAREPTRRIALATMTGLLAYFIDGLTDPLYREPVVYMMYWLLVAMSVALVRIDREERMLSTASSA